MDKDQDATAEHEALLGEPLPVELMNTRHMQRGVEKYDLVGDVPRAARWVQAIGSRLPPAAAGGRAPARETLSDQEARRLRALRDALRVLATELTGAPPEFAVAPAPSRQEAVETVNQLSGRAHVWPVLTWEDADEPRETSGTSADGGDYVVSSLARQAVRLLTGPRRARLRACLAPGCDRFFIKEHSRREWCTRACGNRARVARHYRRHHGETLGTGTGPQG